MTNLHAILAAMTPAERKGALIALDAISRPLLPKEIEAALYSRGTSRSQRKAIVGAIKNFNIIAIVGGEE
jgi:hypothetical protein